jgi:hypothetical protein
MWRTSQQRRVARPRPAEELSKSVPAMATSGVLTARIQEGRHTGMLWTAEIGLHWRLYNQTNLLGRCQEDGSGKS